jgi:hypothetical protein
MGLRRSYDKADTSTQFARRFCASNRAAVPRNKGSPARPRGCCAQLFNEHRKVEWLGAVGGASSAGKSHSPLSWTGS